MALYKYMTFENAIRVLEGTIRFTQPGAFNDPFEMVPELYVPESFGGDKEINISFSVTAPRRVPAAHELDPNFESDQCSDRNSRSIRSSLDRSIGILCLSQNPSSLLMWSYYADEYAGAVIEFDDSHDFFHGHFQMDYRERRPKKDISYFVSSNEPIPIFELCVKPKVWEHEREVRVVRNLSDCKLVKNGSGHKGGLSSVCHGYPARMRASSHYGRTNASRTSASHLAIGQGSRHHTEFGCCIQLGL